MAELRRLDPYGVFVTMGGQQIVPDIPGIDRENVFGIEDVLLGRRVIEGREVAVIGGGHVGLEVAHFLCANNKVTIVEMADEIGASVYYITKFKLLSMLREAGVTFRTGQAIAAVDDGKQTSAPAQSPQADEALKEMKTRIIVSAVFMVVLMYFSMGEMVGLPLPAAVGGPVVPEFQKIADRRRTGDGDDVDLSVRQ